MARRTLLSARQQSTWRRKSSSKWTQKWPQMINGPNQVGALVALHTSALPTANCGPFSSKLLSFSLGRQTLLRMLMRCIGSPAPETLVWRRLAPPVRARRERNSMEGQWAAIGVPNGGILRIWSAFWPLGRPLGSGAERKLWSALRAALQTVCGSLQTVCRTQCAQQAAGSQTVIRAVQTVKGRIRPAESPLCALQSADSPPRASADRPNPARQLHSNRWRSVDFFSSSSFRSATQEQTPEWTPRSQKVAAAASEKWARARQWSA